MEQHLCMGADGHAAHLSTLGMQLFIKDYSHKSDAQRGERLRSFHPNILYLPPCGGLAQSGKRGEIGRRTCDFGYQRLYLRTCSLVEDRLF